MRFTVVGGMRIQFEFNLNSIRILFEFYFLGVRVAGWQLALGPLAQMVDTFHLKGLRWLVGWVARHLLVDA